MPSPSRKAANLSLDGELLSQACALDINLSRAAEEGTVKAVKAERERRWLTENAEAIRAENDHIDRHGLPLAKYRTFWWRASTSSMPGTVRFCCSTCSPACSTSCRAGSSRHSCP
jgi:antitoxin CcdA